MATVQQIAAGSTLPHPGSAQATALAAREKAQAKGTPMDLTLTCRGATVAGVGVSGEQLAGALAGMLNKARTLTRHFPQIAHIPLWSGQPFAQASGADVHIRWVTDAPWAPSILAVLGGLGTAIGLGVFADVSLVTAAVAGAFVAVGIYLVVTHWRLVKQVITQPVATLDTFLAYGLLAVGGIVLLQHV